MSTATQSVEQRKAVNAARRKLEGLLLKGEAPDVDLVIAAEVTADELAAAERLVADHARKLQQMRDGQVQLTEADALETKTGRLSMAMTLTEFFDKYKDRPLADAFTAIGQIQSGNHHLRRTQEAADIDQLRTSGQTAVSDARTWFHNHGSPVIERKQASIHNAIARLDEDMGDRKQVLEGSKERHLRRTLDNLRSGGPKQLPEATRVRGRDLELLFHQRVTDLERQLTDCTGERVQAAREAQARDEAEKAKLNAELERLELEFQKPENLGWPWLN